MGQSVIPVIFVSHGQHAIPDFIWGNSVIKARLQKHVVQTHVHVLMKTMWYSQNLQNKHVYEFRLSCQQLCKGFREEQMYSTCLYASRIHTMLLGEKHWTLKETIKKTKILLLLVILLNHCDVFCFLKWEVKMLDETLHLVLHCHQNLRTNSWEIKTLKWWREEQSDLSAPGRTRPLMLMDLPSCRPPWIDPVKGIL